MVGVSTSTVFATQEAGNQLRKVWMTQRHMWHPERRDDFDTGALEITAPEHNDIAKPHEPTSTQRLNLLVGGCDEGRDPISTLLIEPLVEPCRILSQHSRIELVTAHNQHAVVGQWRETNTGRTLRHRRNIPLSADGRRSSRAYGTL